VVSFRQRVRIAGAGFGVLHATQLIGHATRLLYFTYHCDGNNHFSLVDHFVCSSHLVDDTDKMCILVDGCNTSDHFAISVTMKMSSSSPHVIYIGQIVYLPPSYGGTRQTCLNMRMCAPVCWRRFTYLSMHCCARVTVVRLIIPT